MMQHYDFDTGQSVYLIRIIWNYYHEFNSFIVLHMHGLSQLWQNNLRYSRVHVTAIIEIVFSTKTTISILPFERSYESYFALLVSVTCSWYVIFMTFLLVSFSFKR